MPGPAGLSYSVNGVDFTSMVLVSSTNIQDQLSSRNTCDFTVRDFSTGDLLRPVVGHPIIILDTDGTTRLFAGSVDDMDEEFVNGQLPFMQYSLRCVDFNQICDRFLVAQAYINPLQTLSTVVNDIVTNVLTGEGVTTAGVDTGPIIAETKIFNYQKVTDVFNELTTLTNFVWWIDYNKVLYFKARDGFATSFTLDKTNALRCVVKTSRALGPYRNTQFVRAGTAKTADRTELLTGDGQRKTYNTSFEIEHGPTSGTDPVVLLNGTPKTIGKKGIDTGKFIYYTPGSNQLSLDDTGTALVSTDVLSVEYVGRFPSIVLSQNDVEITSRAAIEGGSGIYQNLKIDRNLNDFLAQTNLANSLLARYGFIPQQLTITTDQVGIRSGMLIQCNFPENNVSGPYLVQSVSGVDMAGMFMRYTVNLVNG